ncbi:MAG: GTP 3',8-cyclase MoaA [Candidatus Omnitrophica bacterium]|nr:GTP 3',8-cyclase MoaA [Candidatus Omnitrophota bacterium]
MNSQEPLIDSHGRRIDYLRVSLTDLCNFRCVYCMPAEGIPFLSPSKYLTRSEIVRFVRLIGQLGVTRVRLTGGEPLLRRDILDIIHALKEIETVRDLSITTNASRLGPLVEPLKEAGLDRINISLDSMEPERFKAVTLSDTFHQVLEAVFLALQAGFPVKLNMVVLKGLTRQEIVQFVRLARDYPLEVRFLEFMPLCGTGWRPDLVLPIQDVRSIVFENFELEELLRNGNVAQSFAVRGGKGSVGFIASLTESFCDSCSRIRLTADGKIRPCLFSEKEVSIKELLRNNAPDEEIIRTIRHAAAIKPKGNWFNEKPFRSDEDYDSIFASNPMIRTLGG